MNIQVPFGSVGKMRMQYILPKRAKMQCVSVVV